MRTRFQSFLLLHMVVFIWGFTGILGKLISLQAIHLVWLRILLALFSLFIYLKIKGISLKTDRRSLLKLFLVGVLIAFHWIFFYHSIKVSNVSVAVVCLSSATLFTSIFEPLLYRRRVYMYELIFGILVMGAIAFIFSIDAHYLKGMAYGIGSAVFSSMFTVINGQLASKHNPVALSFYELTGGFILITGYFILTGNLSSTLFSISTLDWMYLIILATVCTAFTFVLSVDLMKVISPFTVVLAVNLEPVYSIIMAAWLFGEYDQLNMSFYIGTLIILASIFVNAWVKGRLAKEPEIQNTGA
jgi:drug/metabolite transporter (DMT)-like permease